MVRSFRATLTLGNNISQKLTANKCAVLSKPVIRFISYCRPCYKEFTNVVAKSMVPSLRIGVQGAPFDRGQPKEGVADGPKYIRETGFIQILKDLGHDVKDFGDIDFGIPPREESGRPIEGPKNVEEVSQANKMISESTAKILNDQRICLTLGGDHSIGIGTLNGVSSVYNDLAVLWVDAHTDINTASTSGSGNMHGMSLSFVVKELQEQTTPMKEFSWVHPRISANNLAYIALRDVDSGERAILKGLGITAYSMKDVDHLGIVKVTQMALAKITKGHTRPLHVSFDIDALDDLEAATTGTPVPGGLTLREGISLLEEVYSAGNLVSMDLVEVNPKLGNELQARRTTNAAKHLIINTFGYKVCI